MAIIKKRADQLQPGDILPADSFKPRRVVQWAEVVAGFNADGVMIGTVTLERPQMLGPQMPTGVASLFDVEVPNVSRETPLTPAQQHAGKIVALLEQAVRWFASADPIPTPALGSWCAETRKLLDLIEPPAPPTLTETLAAAGIMADYLHLIADDPSAWRVLDDAALKRIDEARAVITRAREASK